MTGLDMREPAAPRAADRALTWVLGMRGRPERLLVANVLVDAAGSALYLAALLLFAITAKGMSASAITTTVGVSGLLAVGLTYVGGYLADRFSPKSVLVVLQLAQAITGIGLFFADDHLTVAVLIGASVVLSRVQSPVRGALPVRYVGPTEIVSFKAAQRSRTILVTLVFGAVGAAIAGSRNPGLIETTPLVNAASYLVCTALTVLLGVLPAGSETPAAGRAAGELGDRTWIVVVACLVGVTAISGAMAGTVVPLLLGTDSSAPSWLLTELVVIEFVAVVVAQRLLQQSAVDTNTSRTTLLLGIAVMMPVALVGLYATVHASTPWLTSILLAVSALVLSGCEVAVMLLSWHWQYSLGPDAQRGRIIAVFAIGASVTVSLAAPLGNFVLHRSLVFWLGTGLVLGAVALLLIPVQRRATAVSTDEKMIRG